MKNLDTLSVAEVQMVAANVTPDHPTPNDARHFAQICISRGLDHADITLAALRMEQIPTVERLVGKPIYRHVPKPIITPPSPSAQKRVKSDPRIIRLLQPHNPKQPGSKSHARYALYQDGMRVDEYVRAGGVTADLSWDMKREYIRIENGDEA
jgi:hypothetical protein